MMSSLEESAKVANGIAMTSDPKLIEAMAQGKGPRQSLFVLGYAGWAPGQPEGEPLAGSWFVVSGDKAFIFDKDADRKWRQAMDKRKIPCELWDRRFDSVPDDSVVIPSKREGSRISLRSK